ncbi:MAG: hypothetical protein IMW91_10975 [Firmicutes bacterium]|nr:hypothetical protein [Bacillota bacterium]
MESVIVASQESFASRRPQGYPQELHALAYVAIWFFASRLILTAVGLMALQRFPSYPPAQPWGIPALPQVFSIWIRWDSQWYLRIAAQGYTFHSGSMIPEVFYPLYPALISLFPRGAQSYAALGISWSAAIAALWFVHRLAESVVGRAVADRSIRYLVLFPTGFYLSAAYTESLFLLCSAAALWAAQQKRWGLAGWAAFAAALTRNIGILLVIPLIFSAWAGGKENRPGVGLRRVWKRLRHPTLWGWHKYGPVLLPIAGFFFWVLYLDVLTGKPTGFLVGEGAWGRHTGSLFLGIPWAINNLLHPVAFPNVWGGVAANWSIYTRGMHNAIDLSSTLLWIGLVVGLWRSRLPFAWTMWTTLGLLVPLAAPATPTLYPLASLPRYCLVLFPAFILLAQWAQRRPWIDTLIPPLFAGFQVLLFAMFVIHDWVA